MPKLSVVFVSFILLAAAAFGQKEHNNWYFGDKAAITFNGGGPTVLTNSSMVTSEGCASVSDSSGKLLFYTNGENIWDASHQIMQNGGGLLGNASTTQSSVIVPKPGNPYHYIVFALDHYSGTSTGDLYFSEVDMTLNSGLGGVVSKNNLILPITGFAEKMTAVRHSNGRFFWVITHGMGTNSFFSYLIDNSGVNLSPVVSNTGMVYIGPSSTKPINAVGCMKSSPDGKRLAVADNQSSSGFVEIYDFDNATGIISNSKVVDSSRAYGVEFSPNGQILYSASNFSVYQYDITVGNPINIQNSKLLVGPGGYALQLGPDNKIYVAVGGNSLHVINSPNLRGAACQFQTLALTLSGPGNLGLPNYISRVQFPYINKENFCLGDTTWFTFNDSSILDSVHWNFGDLASGPNNTTTAIEPYHVFSDTGTFIVYSVLDFTPYYSPTPVHDTLWDTVRIIAPLKPDLGPDTSICIGSSLKLDAKAQFVAYKWQNNSTWAMQTITDTGLYWVQLTDTNGCKSEKDSIHISHIPAFNIPYDWEDTSLCIGDFFRLSASYPGVDYLWNDGSNNSFIDIFKGGKYWVKWENACEEASDTLNVKYLKELDLNLGRDSTFCFGETVILEAGDQDEATYLWQDGSTSDKFSVTKPGKFYVNVKNKCGEASDTVTLSQLFPPEVYLGEDTILCRYSSTLLDAANQGATYLWQDGSTGRYMRVTSPGDYWVDVKNDCALDNDSLMALFTYPPQVELGEDTIICNDQRLELDAYNLGATYTWQNGDDAPAIFADRAGTYSVEVKNACGIKTDEVIIDKEDCSCQVYLPNSFTPSGDNLNEEFKAYCSCQFKSYNLKVFNRWGEQLYEANSSQTGWDGNFNGEQMPNGGYVWFLEYEVISDSGNKKGSKRGKVFLLR